MKDERHLFKLIHKSFSATFIIFAFFMQVMPKTVYAFGLSSLDSETIERANDFDKEFRQARDLIDDEQWAKAAEKFRELVNRYPYNKSVDVALYWLAFCQKKQKNFKESDAALDNLLEKFPASSWASDARVMKLEIAAPLKKIYPLPASSTMNTTALVSELQAEAQSLKMSAVNLAQQSKSYQEFSEIFSTSGSMSVSPDRQEEIKIAAFQSLLVADAKRAIETLGEFFKPEAKASDIFKQEALRSLGRSRVSRTPSASRNARSSQTTEGLISSTDGEKIDKQIAVLLRETLLKGFQIERSVKIRKEIIYALLAIGDDQSADDLARFYVAENNQELKKTIISSFGSMTNGFSMSRYYQNSQNYTGTLNAISDKSSKKGFDKLLEIVRTEKDAELRRLAFSTLQGFANRTARAEIVENFSQMYDEETDEEFKISIIYFLAASKQKQAEMKLLDIARNDKSDKLRLEAIRSLQNSKNPEVLKFLEDLIK